MRREYIDFEALTSYNELYNGYIRATSGSKGDREDAIEFGRDPETLRKNLLSLQRRLRDETWQADPGRTFKLFTEKKWRDITVVDIEDRIVHQVLVKFFNMKRRYIRRTFGSIKKRGTLAASKQVRRDVYLSGFRYVIITDAKKYYPNIVKERMVYLLRRMYKGEKALRLFEKVIRAYLPEELGMSIGALTSQDCGNMYYTPLDHFVLEVLKVKYYSRLVDNTVMLVRSKKEGARVIDRLIREAPAHGIIYGTLEMFPLDGRKIDFCGYTVDSNAIAKMRTGTLRNFSRKLRQLDKKPLADPLAERSSVYSYLGLLRHCHGERITNILKSKHYEVFNRVERCASKRTDQQAGETAPPLSTGGRRVSHLFQRAPGNPAIDRRGGAGDRGGSDGLRLRERTQRPRAERRRVDGVPLCRGLHQRENQKDTIQQVKP